MLKKRLHGTGIIALIVLLRNLEIWKRFGMTRSKSFAVNAMLN